MPRPPGRCCTLPWPRPTQPETLRRPPNLADVTPQGPLGRPPSRSVPLGAARLAANDNWSGTTALKNAFSAVGAFPLADDTSRYAALLVSPSIGAYTVTVSGGAGLALIEIYYAGPGLTPRLTNLSARTLVGTGALIAGFVVDGTLADPVLTLCPLGSETVVATSDDWAGTAALKAAFTSVGAFPFSGDTSKDAALVLELPPGAYTATVSGRNNTTGVALVEVYELP